MLHVVKQKLVPCSDVWVMSGFQPEHTGTANLMESGKAGSERKYLSVAVGRVLLPQQGLELGYLITICPAAAAGNPHLLLMLF